MKSLVVEDDFTSRTILQKILSKYGDSHIAVNGKEAISIFIDAYECGEPYEFICLDIMMPEMDGQQVLKQIRDYEKKININPALGVKIIMTTAMDDSKSVLTAFREQCDGYLVKPINCQKVECFLAEHGLLQ